MRRWLPNTDTAIVTYTPAAEISVPDAFTYRVHGTPSPGGLCPISSTQRRRGKSPARLSGSRQHRRQQPGAGQPIGTVDGDVLLAAVTVRAHPPSPAGRLDPGPGRHAGLCDAPGGVVHVAAGDPASYTWTLSRPRRGRTVASYSGVDTANPIMDQTARPARLPSVSTAAGDHHERQCPLVAFLGSLAGPAWHRLRP